MGVSLSLLRCGLARAQPRVILGKDRLACLTACATLRKSLWKGTTFTVMPQTDQNECGLSPRASNHVGKRGEGLAQKRQ
jgi:hypothetical protein